jgi:membrane-anchored protein YejM (alkaline phosphatase superfamily)
MEIEKIKQKNRRIKLGIFLMIFSGVFFAATLIFPLTQLPVKTKVIASTTSLILMEIVFWSGGLLVGKELFTRYKRKLNPVSWFKKSPSSAEENMNT